MYFFFLQHDLNKANEEILARRQIKKQQEKAEELKVIEYMKQKAVSIVIYLTDNPSLGLVCCRMYNTKESAA